MDAVTFSQLAARWRGRAVETCLSCGVDAAVADDVAQDVLVKLWLMRDELDRYRSVEALAVVMARNLTIDHFRARRTVPLDTVPHHEDATHDALTMMMSREETAWLNARIRQLPSRQHAVLVMRQVEHRSYDEIASILGIEETSAKTLLSRARHNLLKHIEQRNGK